MGMKYPTRQCEGVITIAISARMLEMVHFNLIADDEYRSSQDLFDNMTL